MGGCSANLGGLWTDGSGDGLVFIFLSLKPDDNPTTFLPREGHFAFLDNIPPFTTQDKQRWLLPLQLNRISFSKKNFFLLWSEHVT